MRCLPTTRLPRPWPPLPTAPARGRWRCGARLGAWAALLAMAWAVATPAAAQADALPRAGASDAGFSAALLLALNQYRLGEGLPPLVPDPWLLQIASEHDQQLVQQGQLSHGGFAQRLQRSGARLCVENLAAGHSQPGAVLTGWRESPAHHRNLLEPQVQRIGLARLQGVVAMLACSADAAPTR